MANDGLRSPGRACRRRMLSCRRSGERKWLLINAVVLIYAADMKYSVIGVDGQVYGRVEIVDVASWVTAGRVLATTNLVEGGTGKIVVASTVPELVAALSSPRHNRRRAGFLKPVCS